MRFLPACLAALLLSAVPVQAASEWPIFRGPEHNGISSEKGWLGKWPADGPKQVWKASVETGFSSIAIAGGKVYTMGNRGDQDIVFALDAATGKELWKHSYACKLDPNLFEGGPGATPTVEGKTVYTFSREGHVFALNADSGAVVWTRDVAKDHAYRKPSWGFCGSPLVQGNLVILNAGSNGIGLDKVTGKTVWKSAPGIAGYSTPVPFQAGGKTGIALMTGEGLALLSPTDGAVISKAIWKTAHDVNAADPVIHGDTAFVASGYGKGGGMFKLGVAEPLWTTKVVKTRMNGAVRWADHIYGVSDNGMLSCLVAADGAVKWSEKGFGEGSLLASDGKLIVLSADGELVIAEATPAGFKALARARILTGKCWTVPAILDGKVYARNAVGDLVCVDVKGK